MKSYKNLLLSTVFGIATLKTGFANAVTINEFVDLPPEIQNAVVSTVLQQLVDSTAIHSGRESAICMANLFTNVKSSTNQTGVTDGMLTFIAQMEVQKREGNENTEHVEDILQAVYAVLLQEVCLDKEGSPSSGPS